MKSAAPKDRWLNQPNENLRFAEVKGAPTNLAVFAHYVLCERPPHMHQTPTR